MSPSPRLNLVQDVDVLREHVRRKGHKLAWFSSSRSQLEILCVDCDAVWVVARPVIPNAVELVADLNQTPQEVPTWWDRLLLDPLR